jgi:hypothetical protein
VIRIIPGISDNSKVGLPFFSSPFNPTLLTQMYLQTKSFANKINDIYFGCTCVSILLGYIWISQRQAYDI